MVKLLRFFTIISILNLFIVQNTYADIIHADPLLVSPVDQWFEASTQYNVVVRVTITADVMGDTLTVFGVRDDVEVPYALDTVDIVSGSVRLWYMENDTGDFSTSTAQYVTSLTPDGSDPYLWYDLSLNQFVKDGSALYVTIDITSAPTPNAVASFYVVQNTMFFASGLSQPSADLPVYPQPPNPTAYSYITPYYPATGLEIIHQTKSFSTISTGQTFYPLDLIIHNTGTPFTAPIFVSGLTITVKDQFGSTISPDTAIESIGLRNKSTEVVLATVSTMPSSPVGVFIPLAVSVTAIADLELELFATVNSNTTTVVSEFLLELNSDTNVDAIDAYTRKTVSVTPAAGESFPMQTELFTVFFSATDLEVYHTPMMTENTVVLKGQTNVNPVNFTFNNPGTTRTSRVDVTHLTLAVTNGDGDPITPSTVFSRVAISGSILYGETTNIPSTGSLITITLSKSYASVPVYQPLTVTVMVDILPDASVVEFRLSLAGSAGVTAQDANTILPVNVRAAFDSDPFPMFSNTVRIASSFLVTGQSVAPTTLYPEQQAALLELTFSHPGPADVGNLVIQGITLTARDQTGAAIALAPNCTTIFLTDPQGTIITQATPEANNSSVYLALPNVAIAAFNSTCLRLEVQISAHPESQTLRLGISSNADVSVTQPSDPSRPVFVSGTWPILSESAALGGGEGELRLSNYPNPFSAGRTVTRISYFLKQSSTVTARLYTLTGDQVKSLLESEFQTPGEQILEWNGRTATGSAVKNGIYLLRIEAVAVATGKTITQIRKIAVVK